MVGKNQAIELAIFAAVTDGGELRDDEIILAVQSEDDDADDADIRKMIAKLDRAGTITRQNSESGYQITATGRSALDGLRSKMEARFIAPYTNWAPVECAFTFTTPTLACVTDPGGVGISRFVRVGETYEYRDREIERTVRGRKIREVAHERITITPGRVALLGGQILTSIWKASRKGDPTVTVDASGVRRVLPDTAWQRVRVSAIILPADQPIIKASRRPTNIRGQAIGEIVHEALPGGTTVTIRAHFPMSHFSESYLINLFDQVQDVGISSAGTGKGGIWGVGVVSSLIVNGRQVWPDHPDAAKKVTPVRMHMIDLTASGAGAPLQSFAERMPGLAGVLDASAASDPRDRVIPGSIRTVQGANGKH